MHRSVHTHVYKEGVGIRQINLIGLVPAPEVICSYNSCTPEQKPECTHWSVSLSWRGYHHPDEWKSLTQDTRQLAKGSAHALGEAL